MAKRYGTFLVRYWGLRHGEERVIVEHVQSGGAGPAGLAPRRLRVDRGAVGRAAGRC